MPTLNRTVVYSRGQQYHPIRYELIPAVVEEMDERGENALVNIRGTVVKFTKYGTGWAMQNLLYDADQERFFYWRVDGYDDEFDYAAYAEQERPQVNGEQS